MSAKITRKDRISLVFCVILFAFLLGCCLLAVPVDYSVQFEYAAAAFVFLMVLAARPLLGRRKDNQLVRGDICRFIVIVLMSFGLLTYTAGLILGFNYSYFSLSLSKNLSGFVPALLLLVALELMRAYIAKSHQRSYVPIVIFTLFAVLLNIATNFSPSILDSSERIFIFAATTVAPIIARQALCSFLALHVGLLPCFLFHLPVALYVYLLPIVPNLGDYIYSVVHLILPFIIYLSSMRTLTHLERDHRNDVRANYAFITVPLLLFTIALTALISGIFGYKMIAIASGSMEPIYGRGDVVIYQKLTADKIAEGEILVFAHDGMIITHRVKAIDERNGELYFITQGDANENEDAFATSESQVYGRVVLYSKFIGFPTVWLSEFFGNL